jgi:glycine/D-amino acid oxidase-like deaminating enzyme
LRQPLNRRAILAGLGMAGLGTYAPRAQAAARQSTYLAPVQADPGRIRRITVCTRPFRAAGPRLEVETVGDKRVVHNYGHGGAGWSLSWGSAELARDLALDGGTPRCAVIGCGIIGLTSALKILRAGVPTTIYAAERAPFTRSVRATGVWSPDSRVAASDAVAPGFAARWEALARNAWDEHRTFVGAPGQPVNVIDQYSLTPYPQQYQVVGPYPSPGRVPFVSYGDRVAGLRSIARPLRRAEHSFPVASASVTARMTFDVMTYAELLMDSFQREGGVIVTRRLNHPGELADLAEPVIVNCTGYGARALFGDLSVVPIRGQVAWLPAQPEVNYALIYNAVIMLPRSQGILVQAFGASQMVGYGIDDESPDWSEAASAVGMISTLFV